MQGNVRPRLVRDSAVSRSHERIADLAGLYGSDVRET